LSGTTIYRHSFICRWSSTPSKTKKAFKKEGRYIISLVNSSDVSEWKERNRRRKRGSRRTIRGRRGRRMRGKRWQKKKKR
jgi:hypothetical protein